MTLDTQDDRVEFGRKAGIIKAASPLHPAHHSSLWSWACSRLLTCVAHVDAEGSAAGAGTVQSRHSVLGFDGKGVVGIRLEAFHLHRRCGEPRSPRGEAHAFSTGLAGTPILCDASTLQALHAVSDIMASPCIFGGLPTQGELSP